MKFLFTKEFSLIPQIHCGARAEEKKQQLRLRKTVSTRKTPKGTKKKQEKQSNINYVKWILFRETGLQAKCRGAIASKCRYWAKKCLIWKGGFSSGGKAHIHLVRNPIFPSKFFLMENFLPVLVVITELMSEDGHTENGK